MSEPMRAQEQQSPAAIYEERFVPALFGPWARTIAEIVDLAAGHSVLDVACGTGALAREMAGRVLPTGRVVGLDPNEDMLAVARTKRSDVEWTIGRAESLPFEDRSFDRVVSQFGLMFFEDRVAGLREMHRVLRPGGRMTVAVCDAIDHSPGYAVLTELLHRLFGDRAADAFRAPFLLGDREKLLALGIEAGIAPNVTRYEGKVRFPSIASLVSTERACVWTLGGILNDGEFERLLAAAEESLGPFTTGDGGVVFGLPALILTATRV